MSRSLNDTCNGSRTAKQAEAPGIVVSLLMLMLSSVGIPDTAHADMENFDLSGSIYTKWLYRNNDQMGVVSYGNPFWPESFSGDNGVATEFDWTITGRPSQWVTTHIRLKSRFGSTWHDFFENGNMVYPEENTSAESLGMDHAEYIKLRGYAVDIHPPYSWLDNIHIGSTDLGYFDEWTLGRIRYTDRDNAKGVFFSGALLDGDLSFTSGVVALPKLWAGPGWSTGIGDVLLINPFYSLDYGYAINLDYYLPGPDIEFIFNGLYTRDYEIDLADPDAEGSLYPECTDELGNPIPGCEQDGSVDLDTRYQAMNGTLTMRFEPFTDVLFDLLGGVAMSRINGDLVSNGVANNAGIFPMPYKDTLDFSSRMRLDLYEPFGAQNLNIQLEYFNIGAEWVSHFAARREADILLTDGFISGGQLPTLNIANEFMDFDESFFESAIGWHGLTALLEGNLSTLTLALESTLLTYNTNRQGRDVENIFPDFLHNQGYTDTDFYDFANVLDRGRDLRAVYGENQERSSLITRLESRWDTGWQGLQLKGWCKYILDVDERNLAISEDNYRGDLLFTSLVLSMPVTDEIEIEMGGHADYWRERNRSGNNATGYFDYETLRLKGTAGFSFVFGGVQFNYRGEYLHKNQSREVLGDRIVSIFRSKATLGVSW